MPRAHLLNSLRVDRDVAAGALVAALDDLYDGFLHRRAFVERPEVGARLAPQLRERGWHVQRDVYMVLRRPRDRPAEPGLAREVDEATLRAVEAATLREEPWGRDCEVVGEIQAQRAALAAGAARTRYFAGAADGVDAAITTLYSDGGVAQVEYVATLAAYRGRGLARATVSAAIDAALGMDPDLVFIVADDEDWPKELYAKLGFDRVGTPWAFTRPRPEPPAPQPG